MAASVLIEESVEIPLALQSLGDFRDWAVSGECPESGRIDFVAGTIEVDMSPEDLYTHGKVKTELVIVLGQRIKHADLGDLYTDSARVSCPAADLSTEPDLVFVSHESIADGRVRLVPKSTGEPERFVELEGAADLIVEIVSDRSVKKDTERLPRAYFAAGVGEFWLIDARCDPLVFRIFRRGPREFVPADDDAQGYQHSTTMDCWYRLERRRNAQGRFRVELRERDAG